MADAALTPDRVRRLAAVDTRPDPLLSLYLNIDGRTFPRRTDFEPYLEALLREARDRGASEADIDRVRDHVHAHVDRSGTRGLALFSCAAHGMFESIALREAVANAVHVNAAPAIARLEEVLEHRGHYAVVLIDRSRARLYRMEAGEFAEQSELVDDAKENLDLGGATGGRAARGAQDRRVEDEVDRHVRRVADLAMVMFEESPFDRVYLGGPDAVVSELERNLHSYIAARVAGRVSVALADPPDVVANAAAALEREAEKARLGAEVERLRAGVGRNNGAVAGIGPVLDALATRRAAALLVSAGFHQPGWRCVPCARLASVGPACAACEGEMERLDDVVEDAVEEAERQSARVEIVDSNADLDVLGQIGAILRY